MKKTKKNKKTTRVKVPTNTAVQARMPVFLAVKKVPKNRVPNESWVVETPIGTVTCSNRRLTQTHRSILDVIFASYEPIAVHSDGSADYAFTLYDIQKKLGLKSVTNHDWIKEKLYDMANVKFRIDADLSRFEDELVFGIFNDTQLTSRTVVNGEYEDLLGQSGHPKMLVQFNRRYLQFIEADIHIHYEKLLPQLLGIESPKTQAIVRFCLSHNNVNSKLSDVMRHIGLSQDTVSASTISKAKNEIIADRELLEKEFGIYLSDDDKNPSVLYKKHKDVWFFVPDEDIVDEFNSKEETSDDIWHELDNRTMDMFDNE